MDLTKTLQGLHVERERLQSMIASFEKLAALSGTGDRKRPGRKSMGAKERQEVSERMKKYWASRRKRSD